MEHGDLAINRPSRVSRVGSGYNFRDTDLHKLGETVWSNKSHHASSVGDFAAADIQLSEPCQQRQEQLTAMGFTTKKNKVKKSNGEKKAGGTKVSIKPRNSFESRKSSRHKIHAHSPCATSWPVVVTKQPGTRALRLRTRPPQQN